MPSRGPRSRRIRRSVLPSGSGAGSRIRPEPATRPEPAPPPEREAVPELVPEREWRRESPVDEGGRRQREEADRARFAKATGDVAPVAPAMPDRVWQVVAIAILAVGLAIRLYDLPLSPFHNDEGVNGWFLTNLVRHGTYAYDPANYHGPTLYYFALVSSILVGLTDVGVRLVPVAYGMLTIGFALAMRRWIGPIGSLAAAALLAVSPGWVYFSRYFIHEELLVCFTVALVYFVLRWWEERRTGYLLGASVAAALLFATKETAILTVAVLVIALACLPLYDRIRGRLRPAPSAPRRRDARGRPEPSLDERVLAVLREPGVTLELVAAAVLFLVVYVAFYSSFFSHWQGVADSLGALAIWTTTGGEDHIHSIASYVEWLVREEPAITVVAVIGGAIAAWEGRSRFALFVALWAFGLFAAYSLIGYKTPWLLLSFLVPMALVGGFGLERLWGRLRGSRVAVAAALGVAVALSGYQSVRLNFSDYDNDANPYVYAHTVRDIYRLMADVDAAAARLGTGADTHVVIMSPDYWPLPWYWRDYPAVGFFGRVVATTEPVLIVKTDQEATFGPDIASEYARQGEYTLRPGVQLVLYLRRDAFGL